MNTLNVHFYFLSGLAVVLFVLAVWIYFRYQKDQSILYYCGFLVGLALMAALDAALYIPLAGESVLTVTRFGYITGVVTFSLLLMFSWYFPIPSRSISRNQFLYWVVPIVFFIPYILFNPMFVREATTMTTGIKEVTGSGFWIFPVFVIVYYFLVLKNFFEKVKYTSGKQRQDLRVFIFVLVLAALAGVIFDVILPAFSGIREPVGIYTSGILFVISVYIVMKK